MAEEKRTGNTFQNLPPGVCLPWEEKLKDLGEIKGDAEMIKREWEKLDLFAYLYLWYWVQR